MPTVDLDSKYLHGTIRDGALRVVIDRPQRRNACTIEMYHGIKKAAVVADRDPSVDALAGQKLGKIRKSNRRYQRIPATWTAFPMRVLLVEDDMMVGRSLERALRRGAMAVDWVRTAADCAAAAHSIARQTAWICCRFASSNRSVRWSLPRSTACARAAA